MGIRYELRASSVRTTRGEKARDQHINKDKPARDREEVNAACDIQGNTACGVFNCLEKPLSEPNPLRTSKSACRWKALGYGSRCSSWSSSGSKQKQQQQGWFQRGSATRGLATAHPEDVMVYLLSSRIAIALVLNCNRQSSTQAGSYPWRPCWCGLQQTAERLTSTAVSTQQCDNTCYHDACGSIGLEKTCCFVLTLLFQANPLLTR